MKKPNKNILAKILEGIGSLICLFPQENKRKITLPSSPNMTYTDLLKNIWNSVYNSQTDTTAEIEKFFHQDYEQCINGVSLNRIQYIGHVLSQKQNMIIDTVDYKQILEKENELFAIYYPKGRNINNSPIEAEVIAYFRFENQKIFRIHGQVRLIKGDLADVDMKKS